MYQYTKGQCYQMHTLPNIEFTKLLVLQISYVTKCLLVYTYTSYSEKNKPQATSEQHLPAELRLCQELVCGRPGQPGPCWHHYAPTWPSAGWLPHRDRMDRWAHKQTWPSCIWSYIMKCFHHTHYIFHNVTCFLILTFVQIDIVCGYIIWCYVLWPVRCCSVMLCSWTYCTKDSNVSRKKKGSRHQVSS